MEKEDYDLCVAAQKGLNAGVYTHGIRKAALMMNLSPPNSVASLTVHPERENGVTYYQGRVVGGC